MSLAAAVSAHDEDDDIEQLRASIAGFTSILPADGIHD